MILPVEEALNISSTKGTSVYLVRVQPESSKRT